MAWKARSWMPSTSTSCREEWEDVRRRSYAQLYPDREMRAQDFVGDLANVCTPLYREFNRRFRQAPLEHYREGDLVCLPFGEAHKEAIEGLNALAVESGIGYPTSFLPFRIYERRRKAGPAAGRTSRRTTTGSCVRTTMTLRSGRLACRPSHSWATSAASAT